MPQSGDESWLALTEQARAVFEAQLGLPVAFLRRCGDAGIDGAVACCVADDAWKPRICAAETSGSGSVAPGDAADACKTTPDRRPDGADLDVPDLLLVTLLERGRTDRPPIRRFLARNELSMVGQDRPATLKQHLRERNRTAGTAARAELCCEAFADDVGSQVTETDEFTSDEVIIRPKRRFMWVTFRLTTDLH